MFYSYGLTLALLLLQCGPPTVLWGIFIAPNSLLILIALGSAFFWTVSLIAISVILQGFLRFSPNLVVYALVLIVSVATEEACRFGLFLLYRRGIHFLSEAASKNAGVVVRPQDEMLIAFAAGFGHAVTHSLVFSVAWLPLATAKGVLSSSHCDSMSWASASAFTTSGLFLLHTGSMVVAFDGLKSGRLQSAGVVAAVHLGAGLLTLSNFKGTNCIAVAAIEIMLGIAAMGAAALAVKKHVVSSKKYTRDIHVEVPEETVS